MRRVAILLIGISILALASVLLVQRQSARPDAPLEQNVGGDESRGLTPDQERELHRLADLGYIAGRAPAREKTGVLSYDASAASAGPTLFTYARGPEAVLIDMEGAVLHAWSVPGPDYWARAHLYSNGDLLVLTADPYALMKIDSESNVLWAYMKPAHHDFEVMDDGTIWVLVREATTRTDIHDGSWLLDDVLIHLDAQGRELGQRVSVMESFEASERYRDWIAEEALPIGADLFHTNSVEVHEETRSALVSIRGINAVAMLSMDVPGVVWALKGPWRMQHEAQLTERGLLLFDNSGLGEQSRVIEVEPETLSIVWSYTEPGFLSRGAGAQQRLGNGNLLISESEAGRIVEVTAGGDIVWEFVNPRTVGDGREKTLGILRAERLPSSFPLAWASGSGAGVD